MRLGHRASITDRGFDTCKPRGHGDVLLDWVDQLHGVPAVGQPFRVDAGPAANVEQHCGWRRKESREQLLRTHPLEHAVCTHPQPVILAEAVDIKRPHLRIHAPSVPIVSGGHPSWPSQVTPTVAESHAGESGHQINVGRPGRSGTRSLAGDRHTQLVEFAVRTSALTHVPKRAPAIGRVRNASLSPIASNMS